jgi:LysM repeat protein
MNEPFTNNTNHEEADIAKKLEAVAEQTHATPYFINELEEQLRGKHKPKSTWYLVWRDSTQTLGWVALVMAVSFLLIWSIRSLVPTPQPASDETPKIPTQINTPTAETLVENNATPVPEAEGYDWQNSKLYLSVPLPQIPPVEVKIYTLKEEKAATVDTTHALGTQFGIQGAVYETPGGLNGATGYLVTDGKQRLYVQSDLHYDYYADFSAYTYLSGDKNIIEERASAAIENFMKSHGLDFPYQIELARRDPGMYYVLPLTPEGFTIRHDYNMPQRLEVTIDANEQVIRMTSYQIGYEAVEGTYGIRTAEEAFQQVLDQSSMIHNGVLEMIRSTGESNTAFWSRAYPDHQTITIFGQPTFYPAAVAGTSPFLSIGQWPVTGNISAIENIDATTFVEATGQFVTDNGIRKFNVDSWKVTSATEVYIAGSLRHDGDQAIITADDGSGEYVIEDAPTDLPLKTTIPDEYMVVYGFVTEGRLNWHSIQYYPSGSGGGGGGGSGTGFYKLNLSGTPVPFPTEHSTQGNAEYIVGENDTLSSIAANFGVSIDQLVEANNLPDADKVFLGQKLTIPGTQQTQPIIGQQN